MGDQSVDQSAGAGRQSRRTRCPARTQTRRVRLPRSRREAQRGAGRARRSRKTRREDCCQYPRFVSVSRSGGCRSIRIDLLPAVDHSGPFAKTGDCVYVRAENGKQLIAQIDSMWIDADNVAYFHGPWYVTPTEIAHAPSRLFYRQEVFLSSIEDTNPLLSVVGRCSVLDLNDYTTCRPTEAVENDCYLCESLYEESRRQIKKLPRDGLKKYTHGAAVVRDEIFFFRRPIQPQRESSPLLAKLGTGDDLTEDSMDAPPSVGSDSGPAMAPTALTHNTPTTVKKPIKIFQKRMVTGYILYSGEVRKSIAAKNPDATFGEVSRMVGNDWRNLPAHVKSEYEEKSQRLNEETAAEMARNGTDPSTPSAVSSALGTPGAVAHADTIFECCWQKCPWQYEDINDLTNHLLQEPNGHVLTTVNANYSEFQCMWRGCSRIRKGVPPFPKMERLLRHVREVHIQKNQGRVVIPADRSKQFQPSRLTLANASSPVAPPRIECEVPNNVHIAGNSRPCGSEPMFVAVPPKPQRLLHSDAYIKYIEGLHSQSRYISNWDKSLRANMEHSSLPDINRVPSHWLGSNNHTKNNGSTPEVVSTLWALRDYMMKDALNISKMLH